VKIILKCTAVLAIIASVLMVVFTTAYVIKIKLSPDTVPSFAGYKPLVVLTGSMEPYIKPVDIILVKNTAINNINVKDIITYSVDGDTYITHRVKEKISKEGGFTLRTQGDANNEEDEVEIYEDMLIGKAEFILPKAGYVIQFAKSFKGFVLLVMVPLFMLLAEQIFKKDSKVKRNRGRRYKRHNNFHA
jgi:signal peptidase